MNADDLNLRIREDGCILCDDPTIVHEYVEEHDKLLARIADLELMLSEVQEQMQMEIDEARAMP